MGILYQQPPAIVDSLHKDAIMPFKRATEQLIGCLNMLLQHLDLVDNVSWTYQLESRELSPYAMMGHKNVKLWDRLPIIEKI